MKKTPTPASAGGTRPRSLRLPSTLRRAASLLAFGTSFVATLTSASAANMTLSQALIDSLNSEIDFSQSTIGSGSLALTNTLGPGDTVYLQAHTRKRLVLKNLTQGTTAAPITVTNTGGQFIIDIPTINDPDGKGIILAGCQHVILKGTPGTGYNYGIKVNRTRYIKNASFSGVKITDNGATGTALKGSLDVEVTGLEICNTGFAGIQAKCEATMPTGYIMDGLHIHHNYIHDTLGEGMYLGWTSAGRHDLANVEVNHNTLVNIGWDAIQVNTCVSNGKVHHNTIIGYGIHSDDAVTEINNPNYWQNEGINGGRNEIAIYNNWVEATTDLAGAAVFQQVYKNLQVYNNVFIHTGVSGDPALEPAIYLADNSTNPVQPGTTVKIMNNTIITPEGPGVKDNTSATSYYYNNIVAGPRNGSAYTTGTITHSGTNHHVATVGAAGFVDPAGDDYNITTSSGAYNTGTNVSSHGITADFIGTARPQGSAYDIGAYERIVASTTPPSITTQPQSQTVNVGANVSFSVTATGTAPLSYQWRKNGTNLSGATNSTYTITNVQTSHAGGYSVVVSNSAGSVTSNTATLTVNTSSPTIVILTPVAWGQSGSGFCPATGAFNEQPTWNASTSQPSGVAATPHSSTNTAYANRYWYIDFGVDYAKVRITSMWTRYRPNSPGSFTGFGSMWWDDDTDTVNDGINAPTLNFATAQNVPNVSNQLWIRDRDFSAAPVTPQGRYLVINTGASPTDRPNEFAFAGYRVP